MFLSHLWKSCFFKTLSPSPIPRLCILIAPMNLLVFWMFGAFHILWFYVLITPLKVSFLWPLRFSPYHALLFCVWIAPLQFLSIWTFGPYIILWFFSNIRTLRSPKKLHMLSPSCFKEQSSSICLCSIFWAMTKFELTSELSNLSKVKNNPKKHWSNTNGWEMAKSKY